MVSVLWILPDQDLIPYSYYFCLHDVMVLMFLNIFFIKGSDAL